MQDIPQALLKEQIDHHPYPLLFVTVSGAHLYGFPSPDSDFDVRGVHILPVEEVIGLRQPQETIQKSYVEQGREIDLVSHDVKKFCSLLLKRNGYVLEQLLSPLILHTTPEHAELKSMTPQFITRFHAYHYLGFVKTQWGLFQKEQPPRVKPLLYVYRILLTGIHLMQTGELEANLVHLNEVFKLPYIPELIERKRAGAEHATLTSVDMAFHEIEYARLTSLLEQAHQASSLPAKPSGGDALHDWLVRLRLGKR